MEKAEMSEKILQAFATRWIKERMQDLSRDLGPVLKEVGLETKETKAFLFELMEKSLSILKKME